MSPSSYLPRRIFLGNSFRRGDRVIQQNLFVLSILYYESWNHGNYHFQSPNNYPPTTSSSSSSKSRGELRLQLHLSTSQKPHQEVLLQHRRLLRVLVRHELCKAELRNWWQVVKMFCNMFWFLPYQGQQVPQHLVIYYHNLGRLFCSILSCILSAL